MTNTELLNRYLKMTSDSSSANAILGQQLINETHKLICNLFDFPFAETTYERTTTVGQQTIQLPANYNKLRTYTVTVGGSTYTPREIPDPVAFDMINYQGTTDRSDFPVAFHITNGEILNYPAFSSAGNTIKIKYNRKPTDMSAADYTTGTITTLAAAGTAVTGTGTTWTSAMIGRFIRITDEGNWYKITAVGSTTTLTIEKPFQGTAIVAGTKAYTIAELPLVDEAFHDLLWLRPVGIYHITKGDVDVARRFFSGSERSPGLFESLFVDLRKRFKTKTNRTVQNYDNGYLNPNFNPRTITIT
jgi:hypothetical protein